MSVNEELEEHAHHAQDPFDKRVAATMAIIAALLAVVNVLGQYLVTEELLLQQKSSDQWAFYQAKSIRRYISQTTSDIVAQTKGDATLSKRYVGESARYRNEGEEIQKEAQALEHESRSKGQEGLRVHFGEVFLEIAIVLSSLAILTKRKAMFMGAIGACLTGAIVAVTALFV